VATLQRQVEEILTRAQAEGALGSRPITEVIAHARGFVAALPAATATVIDLGTGAGVPGLVIALDCPDLHVTLVDRRDKRIDALHRAVRALGWESRVRVVAATAEELCAQPAHRGVYDAVVARGFGSPEVLLPLAVQLVRVGGVVLVSEPPEEAGSRWDLDWVQSLGCHIPERVGPVVRFHVEHVGGATNTP
jgi:16S rRNA (guanine527-N7)-methyltransferase